MSNMSKELPTPTILIVDDSEESAGVTAMYLELGGFLAIVILHSAKAAYRYLGIQDGDGRAQAHPVDLIVMDLRMPGIDGIEACARIRVNPATRDVPILMLTAARDIESLNQAFVAGANDFVNKPVSEIDLLARVRTLLRLRREQQRRRRREAELKRMNADLQRTVIDSALFDPLTGLAQMPAIELLLRTAAERRLPMAMAMVQLDDLELYATHYGEAATEGVVGRVGRLLAETPAPLSSLAVRYDRMSFLILEPGAKDPGAMIHVCDSVRHRVEALDIENINSIKSERLLASTIADWSAADQSEQLITKVVGAMERRIKMGVAHAFFN